MRLMPYAGHVMKPQIWTSIDGWWEPSWPSWMDLQALERSSFSHVQIASTLSTPLYFVQAASITSWRSPFRPWMIASPYCESTCGSLDCPTILYAKLPPPQQASRVPAYRQSPKTLRCVQSGKTGVLWGRDRAGAQALCESRRGTFWRQLQENDFPLPSNSIRRGFCPPEWALPRVQAQAFESGLPPYLLPSLPPPFSLSFRSLL
mmetsp:Transcript_10242/g.31292  ORF Transcript_10242/g.31292 Transcript_10242/m.31292 type:complete len:205 (-) Transcript_10242:5-619(-)